MIRGRAVNRDNERDSELETGKSYKLLKPAMQKTD